MEILLLSPFFFPEPISTGKYNTYLAKALVQAGQNVTVFASHPVYPNWQPEINSSNLAGMEIKRGGAWISYPKSAILRRAVLELWYLWFVLNSYMSLKFQPSIVIPIFPPSLFFMVLNLLMPSTTCRIGIVHDLQGVYAKKSNSLVGRIVNWAIYFVEKNCFNACDHLIFLSESMAKHAITEYQLGGKSYGVCYPFVALPEQTKNYSEALVNIFLPNTFNVVYSGALGEKQNPEGLMAFMKNISQTEQNVTCHIFSAGPLFEQLSKEHQNSLGSKLHFHELVPIEQLSELYARSELQIIPQALNTSEGSLPSKLPNLLAAGVPVFVICDSGSEIGDLVNHAEAGIVSNSWDLPVLVEKFRECRTKIAMESKSDRSNRLQSLIKSKFSIDSVVESILIAEMDKHKEVSNVK